MTRKPSTRADRRRLAKTAQAPVRSLTDLGARVRAAAQTLPGREVARGAKVVDAVITTAVAENQSLRTVAQDLASGAAALRAGAIDHAAQASRSDGPLQSAACRSGCAFCCILSGKDGGLITQHEAEALHAALAPHAGAADGTAWHPRACPALDPASQTCRAYEVRPLICRAYFSTDVDACKAAVDGKVKAGTAVLGSYPLYLAVHAIARAILGAVRVPTYSLVRVAAAAVRGEPLEATLKSAKHAPSVLNGERDRIDPGRL